MTVDKWISGAPCGSANTLVPVPNTQHLTPDTESPTPHPTSPRQSALLIEGPVELRMALILHPFRSDRKPREGRHLRKINLLSLTQPSSNGVVDA